MSRAPALTMRDLAGRTFGRYQVLTQLAAGGMASVHIARTRGLAGFERLVALKLLHPHLAYEEEFITMFLDEARLAALIRHPNVVPTLDISDTGGDGYFIVMEYIEGDHLGALLAAASKRREGLPVPVVSRVTLDALNGLSAAHELRDEYGDPLHLVHRDISPHNVMVGVDGVARLTDFGVAKAEKRLSTTRAGQLKGKLSYMAPEQASSGETDQRSDLFSTGILVWEALTTRRLFKAETNGAILNRVLNGEIPPPSTYGQELRPFDAVLAKALDREPDARFQSALEFAEALEGAARQSGGIAPSREVGAHVRRLVGEKLSQQRGRVRDAFERFGRSEVSHDAIPLPADSSLELDAVELEEQPRERADSIPSGALDLRTTRPGKLRPPPLELAADDETTRHDAGAADSPEDEDETILAGAIDPALLELDDEDASVQRSGRDASSVRGKAAFRTMRSGELPLLDADELAARRRDSPIPAAAAASVSDAPLAAGEQSEPAAGMRRAPLIALAILLMGAGAGFFAMRLQRPASSEANGLPPAAMAPPSPPANEASPRQPAEVIAPEERIAPSDPGPEAAPPSPGDADEVSADEASASEVSADEASAEPRTRGSRGRTAPRGSLRDPGAGDEVVSSPATMTPAAAAMNEASAASAPRAEPSTAEPPPSAAMSSSRMSAATMGARQLLLDDEDGLGSNPYRR